ncbi:polyketide synthase [Plenodomus lindquistii]|nr:polyketide synthase [Plenodomus lindquistii]
MAPESRIAVIGLSYRAPGVHGKSLWDYLSQARSAWTGVPTDRYDQSAYYQSGGQKSGVVGTKGAHFIDDPFAFDAAFFNMRADEAKHADPQHRLMLEVALEAAEDAGKTFVDLAGKKIGVFVGSGQHEYAQRLGDDEHAIQTFSGTGAAPCMAANRVSYFFDIDGPSVVADAACASSVYAADMAVRALRNGECDGAFVGSASLNLSPAGWLVLEKTGALSEHGRSYSYDTKASGFGRGEGAACLLIKRYDDAVRDGDPIQALILSTACNHSGRSDGITMPNGLAQQKLLWAVHNAAGVDPSDTPVVEGHGTGTAVGDPIEAGAFTAVLARNRTASNPIYLGSLKSNFGHLEGASGVLAMVKAIMMLKKGMVLPTAGFEKINPKIEGHEKIKIPEMPLPWPENEQRRCVVTNFGFGGSNSAILMEAAPPKAVSDDHAVNGANGTDGHSITKSNGANGHSMKESNGTNGLVQNGNGIAQQTQRLYVFSAKTQKSLTSYLNTFDEYLDTVPESSDFTRDLSYTLGQRRNHHPYRVAAVADSIESLQERLSALKPTRTKERAVLFVFTGQGAQHAGMATGLGQFEIFDKTLKEAELQLQKLGATWSVTEELRKPPSESRIDDAEISQPACTVVQLALVALLRDWGITPAAVTGHSSGEIAAAYAAGLITFQQAVAVSYFRGQAAAQLAAKQKPGEKGAMLALGVNFEEASRLIEEHAEAYATVAAVNSSNSVTISGDQSAIDNVHKAAEATGLFARKLKVQMAYHSRHMEAVAHSYLADIEPYFSEVAPFAGKDSTVHPGFVSSVTGRVVDRIEPSYWVKNLVQTVMFMPAVQGLLAPEHLGKSKAAQALPRVVIEIGPHAALKNPIKQTAELVQVQQNWTPASFTYLPTLLRGNDATQTMLELAGTLFTLGARVELRAVNQTDKHKAEVITELPAYAWDKTDYELRPRSTNDKYFPGENFHPLLGRKISPNASQERTYRQVFTLDEMPWIRDHVVGGATIFPMTGYMSCAIEAVRRTLSTTAAAFLVTDFHVVRSLEIHEETTVDMTTKLKPAAIGEGSFSTKAWSFEIMTWAEESGWTKHSWGQIEPEMNDMTMDTPTFRASLPLVNTRTGLKEHDINAEYETAGLRATLYGPSFRNNVKFFEGKGYTILEHRLRDLGEALRDPYARGSPVSIDPPTLDGFLQGGGPLQYDEHGRRPAQMPNYISRFRVSNKIPSDPSHRFDVVMRRLDYDVRGGRMHVGVAAFARDSDDNLTPIAEWESCAFRNIGSAEEVIDPSTTVPDNWSWEVLPRYDFVPQEQLRKKLRDAAGELDVEEDIRIRKGEEAACYFIEKALRETADLDYSKLPHHLARFVHWGFKTVAEYNLDYPSEPTALLNEVRTSDAQGELICIMGEHIEDILRGKIEPLEIMLTDGRLTRHYEADVTNAHLSKVLGHLTEYLADLEPNQRILEIGGGTAGTTLPVIEGLSRGRDELAVLDYTFTDISSGFFEMARKKLSDWSQRITYKKLDITQDPSSQGFEQQDYDVVIAANVLHATADMVKTMIHVRSLLKPGGKLILLEAMRHPASVLPFSLLPGWWEAEDKYRDHEAGPMMPANVWNQLLLDSGFSGVDVVLPSRYGTDKPFVSILCSTRIGKQDESRPITICGPFLDETEVEFAQSVADLISTELGYPTEMKPYAEIDPEDKPYYVFIDSPRESALQNMDQDKFKSLQKLLLQNTGLLWVTPEGSSPDAKIIQGMVRTLRMEVDLKNLILFEDVPCTYQGAMGILKLATKLRDPELSRDQDFDFAWHDGAIQLPRMRQLKEVKEQFAVEEGVAFRKTQKLWDGSDRGLEMTIDAAGSPDTIYFQRTDVSQVDEDEVVVRVEAAGVGHRDLEVVLGLIPWAPPGYEGAGKIIKTGSRVSHLREGDDIFFLTPDSSALATEIKLPSWLVGKIPQGVSITDAATLPLAYSLAVLALTQKARLRKNETVLIHAATGSVGQACVMLAQNVGAHVYVTAGNEAKRDFLHQRFGIPKDRIFSSRTPEFRDQILSATANKGIDVIVNSLSGELMTETWALTAPFGRFIEISKKDAFQNNNLPMKPFNRNVTYTGIDLRDLYQYKRDDVKDVFSEVVTLLERGNIQPIQPVTTTPISQFATALRKLKSGEHMGKMVITLGKDDTVVAETALRPLNVTLKTDATYLVAGGTRGIGLDLAYWMIDHGARYIVLLSRSGAAGPEAQKILNRYKDTDVCVKIFSCNVGHRNELAEVVNAIRDLPPVRGVIHSALLLSDKLFVNATLEDWEIVTTPRVKGAWNLHELMPDDLDFFVALSSFNGDTGNLGQAIYAGTAGFYNAFSQYRNARGQYTVSVALPVVLDVGYVADNNLSEILKESLGVAITMADIRAIFGGILLGPSSPFVYNGRAQTFMVYIDGQPVQNGGWKYFHPVHTKVRLMSDKRNRVKAVGGGADIQSTSWTTAEDPLVGLTEAMITKVSAMTMIEREEVLPDTPLTSYNLDSLVSVELRNWIRRETAVELTLSAIMQADSLRALAGEILSQRKVD